MPEGQEARAAGVAGQRIDQFGRRQPSGLSARDGCLEPCHQGLGMGADVRRGQPRTVQHPPHGIEPVQGRDVERRAPEASAVAAVPHPARRSRQVSELCEPAGHDRPGAVAVRRMQHTDALARHGVFVAAGQIEDPVRHRRQVGRLGHEAVIAVDDHPRPRRIGQRGQIDDPAEDLTGAEEDLADQDQIKAATFRRRDEPVVKGLERTQRHAGDDRLAGLFPALGLTPERMEFAVGRQDADRLALEARDDPQQQVVGVGGEHHRVRRRQVQLAGDVRLGLGDDLAEDQVPFPVRELIGLDPGPQLAVKTGVGPQVMAVRREMQPLRVQRQGAGEQVLVSGHHNLPSVANTVGR